MNVSHANHGLYGGRLTMVGGSYRSFVMKNTRVEQRLETTVNHPPPKTSPQVISLWLAHGSSTERWTDVLHEMTSRTRNAVG